MNTQRRAAFGPTPPSPGVALPGSQPRWFLALASALASAVVFALAAGCAGGQPMEPDEQVPMLPATFTPIEGEGAGEESWCDDFGDAAIAELVNRVVTENLDLRAAWTRLQEADALLRQTRAGLFPTVDVQAQVSRGNARVQTPTGAQAVTATQYGLSAPVRWEVDLWGRIARQRDAAESDRDAIAFDLEARRRSLAARTAELWYELAAARETVDRIAEQSALAQRALHLLRQRFADGQAAALDMVQQQQQIEALATRSAEAELRVQLLEQALALLQGSAPGLEPMGREAHLPALPPPLVLSLPATVLERRPDVLAARQRAISADYRVRAALAERLPSLVLTANLALQAQRLDELFEYLFWNVAAQAGQSVVDGGRRRARIEGQEAARERTLLEYSATLLAAFGEVEDALARLEGQRRMETQVRAQLESAELALELAQSEYMEGLVDYLRVLTAQQSLQDLELRLLDLRAAQWTGRVSLCRAIGAGGRQPDTSNEGE